MTTPLTSSEEPIGADEIRDQLNRIVGSAGFAGSVRLRRFLTYVVEQQLAGEGTKLKEFAIGVEVFDRQGQYDPRLDSIVRVEAGRLRSKIDEYYAGDGAADEIRIGLPRGGYVPMFARNRRGGSDPPSILAAADANAGPPLPRQNWSRRQAAIMVASAALLVVAILAGWRSLGRPGVSAAAPGISIAVLPFEAFSGSDADLRLADQLTDDVTTALARLGTLSVVSRTSARQFQGVRKPMHEIADTLGAQVVMEAAVEVEGDGLLIQPRLVDATIDRKIWVGTYRGPRTDLRDLAARIAAEATAAVLKREADRSRP